MRIIAGQFRHRPLLSPKDDSIRPTSDRVRESIFNIISSRLGPSLTEIQVLDLFAGTGALGFEALSRGAAFTTFVETGAQARGIIREQIEKFGVGGQSKLLRRDATNLGSRGNFKPIHLLFADPPYAQGLGEAAISSAIEGDWLAPNCLIIWEEKRGCEIQQLDGLKLLDKRDYGQTSVHIFAYAGSLAAEEPV